MVLSGKCPRAERRGRKLRRVSVARQVPVLTGISCDSTHVCACAIEAGVEKREGGVCPFLKEDFTLLC